MTYWHRIVVRHQSLLTEVELTYDLLFHPHIHLQP